MTGFILKDLLILRKSIKTYVLFLIGYSALAVLDIFPISAVASVIQIVVMMLPLSAFSYDEYAKWDRYALTLPIGRRTMVGARYLFALLMAAGGAVLSLAAAALICVLHGDRQILSEIVSSSLVSLGLGLLICDILLPLCYQLGVERARPFLYIIIFVPTIAILLLAQSGLVDLSALNGVSESALLLGFAAVPIVMLAGMGASYTISCRILERKEF